MEKIERACDLGSSLILISASAGSGKTTMLADWCRHCKWPVAWLSAVEGDDDWRKFLSYILEALRHINPEIGNGLSAMLQGTESLQLPAALRLAINEMARIPDRFLLVIDDYHVIQDPEAHSIIRFFLEHGPPQMHLLLSSRSHPPLPLPQLMVAGKLFVIGTNDLRFTREEMVAFFRETLAIELTDDEVIEIQNQTEGWVAGLQLVAHSLSDCRDIKTLFANFLSGQQAISEYLVQEVLACQPASLQDWLLRTSVVHSINAGLCNALTGRADSQAILGDLVHQNLFIMPLDEEMHWYRYHHLFRHLLSLELEKRMPTEIGSLHTKASQWYEDHDLISQAIQHAIMADDFVRASHLIYVHSESYFKRSQLSTVGAWIQALPKDVIEQDLNLMLIDAKASLLLGNLARLEQCLLRSEELIREAKQDDHTRSLRGMILVMKASKSILQNQPQVAVNLAEEALNYLPVDDIYHIAAWTIIAEGHAHLSQIDHAIPAYERALQLSLDRNHLYSIAVAASGLAFAEILNGDLYKAQQVCLRSLADMGFSSDSNQISVTGRILIRLGEVLYYWNQLEKAHQYLQKALSLGQREGNLRIIIQANIELARVEHAKGDSQLATERLDHSIALAYDNNMIGLARLARAHLALISLRAERLEIANEWWRNADLQREAMDYYLLIEHIVHACIDLEFGRHRQALENTQHLLEEIEQKGRERCKMEILLIQALALAELENHQAARAHLGRALSLGEKGNFLRPFLEVGDRILPLLDALHDQLTNDPDQPGMPSMIYLDYLRTEAHRAFSESDPHPSISGDHLLTAREMEVIQLLSYGMSNQALAERLSISMDTIKTHLRHIYRKLDVSNRTQAVAVGRARGLI